MGEIAQWRTVRMTIQMNSVRQYSIRCLFSSSGTYWPLWFMLNCDFKRTVATWLTADWRNNSTVVPTFRGKGYSGFQVTGLIEGFLGMWIFPFRNFLGKKIWQVFFGGWLYFSKDFLRYLKQFEKSNIQFLMFLFFVLYHFKARKFGMGLFGG